MKANDKDRSKETRGYVIRQMRTQVDKIYDELIDFMNVLLTKCPELKGDVFALTASFNYTCQAAMYSKQSKDNHDGNPHIPFIISRDVSTSFPTSKTDVWWTVHAERMLVDISTAMQRGNPLSRIP